MKLFILGALLFLSVGCGVRIKQEPDRVTMEENEQGEFDEKRTASPLETTLSLNLIPERRAPYPFPVGGFPNNTYLGYYPAGTIVMITYDR
ncbi:MAG: hypothetical protein H7A38_00170 [Chlamydiales bacterium]|nr:hypothetical protein [Chlamydiales bacterium]